MRRTLLPLILVVAIGLSACGGSTSTTRGGAGTAARPSRPQAKVSLSASGHHPTVGKPWPIVIHAATPTGRPLAAEVHYEFLLGGTVVARRSHYRFHGVFHDVLRWPASSVGYPLTFRAVVTTPLGVRQLDYPVAVRK